MGGISTTHIQIDEVHPTAYLEVILDEDGGHQCLVHQEHALDFIDFQEDWLIFARTNLLYHGTYMLRQPTTRATIAKMKKAGFQMFLDLNLRENYWSHTLLDEWLFDIDYMKLSDHEFAMWHPDLDFLSLSAQIDWMQSFMRERNIAHILFTLGAKGSMVLTPDQFFKQEPTGKIEIHNTVGAGDAFCAGFIDGVLQGKDIDHCLLEATQLAEHICTVDSATSPDRVFYEDFRRHYLKG
ncbi:MAG: carbohydrate kinase family protein [Bdellovibrionota bacterium]